MVILFDLLIMLAFLLGFLIGTRSKSKKIDGVFIVDDLNKNTTKWILDVWTDPEKIPSKKEIRLKIKKVTEGDV